MEKVAGSNPVVPTFLQFMNGEVMNLMPLLLPGEAPSIKLIRQWLLNRAVSEYEHSKINSYDRIQLLRCYEYAKLDDRHIVILRLLDKGSISVEEYNEKLDVIADGRRALMIEGILPKPESKLRWQQVGF